VSTEIVLRFPWGRYHATPWGRHVNEGAVDWPPSPWRLLRALYAVWQFRAPELDRQLVEGVLGKLATPPSYDLPAFTAAATRHYMPSAEHRKGVTIDQDLAVDAFVVLPPGAEVRVRWDVDLTTEQRSALNRLLGQLTYLGRAESLCDAALDDGFVAGPLALRPLAAESGDDAVDVLVPVEPLDVGALTASTTRVRATERRRLPLGSRPVRYRRPETAVPVPSPSVRAPVGAHAVRWSLAGRALPSRHAAVAVTTWLRASAIKAADSDPRPVPAVLMGKQTEAAGATVNKGHGHAHWLAYGDPSGRRLHTVVAWAPDGFDTVALAGLARVDRLFAKGVPDFGPQRLGLESWGSIEVVSPELVGPSRSWRSFTPFAPSLHRKKGWKEDEDYMLAAVRRELAWRGLPEPQSVTVDRGPWRAYRTHRPDKERLRDSRRVWGLRLTFEQEVAGPIAIGALSHFGLGLFLPEP